MSYDEEELQKFNEKANLKEVLLGGQEKGENNFRSQILAQDQFKQEIIDGLLRIRRKTVPLERENGRIYFQEFVRLEDGSGQWLPVSDITEQQLKELKKGGVVYEEGAKDVLTHLNSLTNNMVSLSNLTEEQISELGGQSELALTDMLNDNRDEYGIEHPDDIEWIITSIVRPNVMAGLSKAKNGSFVKELLSQTKLVGSLDDQNEENENFWDNFR